MTAPIRVLYITGWLRSGSTIVGNLLNELPGVLHVGELHYLWQNGVLRHGTNSSCGCGADVTACPLWSGVLDTLGLSDLTTRAEQMMGWQRAGLRTRHVKDRLAGARRGSHPAPVRAAVDQTVALYRALAERGAERLIVDSSKYPAEAAALLGRPELDVRILHTIRDPRATAYSYQRSKEYISPMSPAESTAHWVGFNLASELVGAAAAGRYLRVRQEDLAYRPAEVVTRVMRFAGLDGAPPVDDSGQAQLGVNHTVTGNPDRLSQGTVRIRPDERWRTDLAPRHVAVATGIALPLLRRYDYPVLRRRVPEPSGVGS
ncbi:MAG: sulfotransferase family protein [Actinobacteria bacterium 13_2_20CM_2_71_6]|nr:MAG: sulfotransferase family protein [Actinobacteria bacterium 13_2_20CM_2_71_6]